MYPIKPSIIILSLFLSIFSFAQNDTVIAIPNSHCKMFPPEGFVVADRFPGFQNNSTGATIMVTELSEKYANIIPGLTPEAFLKQKMIISNTEKIQFNGSEATVFTASQTQGGLEYQKLLLIFGAGNTTILVNGIYPVSALELNAAIRTAMFTTIYIPDEFNNTAPIFTISTEGTDFKKIRSMGTNMAYSTDSTTVYNPDAPMFILSNSVNKISKENRKSYAESRIMMLPRGDKNKIISINQISINDFEGYEIIADGENKTGLPQKIYQVILYNVQGDYYLLVGTAIKNMESNLQIFKKLTLTFQVRQS